MNQGRIEQLGAPADLYERPATAFVAGFLGACNLLDGELVGGRRIRATGTNGHFAIGDEVSAGVRPEKLKVSTGADGLGTDQNVIEGRVNDASYVGVSTQYVVRLDDDRDVTVYKQNLETSGVSEQHPAGQAVTLTWSPKHTFVIGRSADQPVGEEQPSA
jgi:spermidine/putrescine transport system ATP-binding protein